MNKLGISLLALALFLPGMAWAQDAFPDGKPVPEWFHDVRKADLASLGKPYVITRHGVKRNSAEVQTEAIQKVIDMAAEKGGVVVIPKGTYVSGALHFKPGTHLWIEGTLKGSDRVKDFPLATTRIEGQTCTYFPALVNIDGVDGFVLGGPGTLDGSGTEFWREMKIRWSWNPDAANKDGQRPRLVFVSNSSHVTVQDLHMKDSPFWTNHAYKSHHLRFLDLTVTSPSSGEVVGYSTDAIDLDACHDVLVKGCYMDVCDDGVVLKGGKGTFADLNPDNGPNEDILIEECTFGRTHGCLTLGSECVAARNVILRNCVSENTRSVLWLKLRPDTPQKYEFIRVENISGRSGIVLKVRPWTQYYKREPRADMPLTLCDHVQFNNIQVESPGPIELERSDQYVLRDFTWDGKDLLDKGEEKKYEGWSAAQQQAVRSAAYATLNYDPAAVPSFTLEDPLAFCDGRKLASASEWPARRQEILELFQREMYGRMPAPAPIWCELLEEGSTLTGFAKRRQVRMWFREDKTGPKIDWLIITPAHVQGPVPVILLLNYTGNHEVLKDPEIVLPDQWMRVPPHERGHYNLDGEDTVFPISSLIARGYAVVTACYCDVSPDPDPLQEKDGVILQDGFAVEEGVFRLWGPRDPSRTDNTTALAAWAWALMRGVDMIEKDPSLDSGRILLTGYSRLGKAAILAGAYDERIPLVVPIQTGGGGVPLSKHRYGECVATEVASFRHWFCRAYDKYAGNEAAMPFDQHLLLSCVAPRALLVEGFDKPWFDTEGEFLALQAASPVWTFLGRPGLPDVPWPADYDTAAIGPCVGYVRRDGGHGISAYDWMWMLDFADKIWNQ